MSLFVAGAVLLALTLGIPARQDRLEAARIALERGIQSYQQGSLDAAQAELDEALEADPDEWRAPFYLGIIQIQLGSYGPAIPYLEQAFILNPKEPKVSNALGVTYFKLGKLDLAKGYFATSVELDPDNADTRAMLETMTRLQRRAEQSGALPEG
jgi:superkiller protein 3